MLLYRVSFSKEMLHNAVLANETAIEDGSESRHRDSPVFTTK